ncbi:MAG TPA: MaoC family dehydratase N-terminal domain-containing protein [Candidatus Nanopelagicales bacterium]|jgi:acyl dehydratase|nr:MaoC family dehydratase N-terminal domain-containing protein [Candidatus Nanopelagicales bacterium]
MTETEPLLLTDALAARIGQTVSYTAPDPLGRAAIRYFASAVGDDNPLYTDRSYARDHGFDDVIAPPTLLAETNQYMTGARDDDGFLGHSWNLEVPGTRLVRGGNSYRFAKPAGPDTVVTATWRIADMKERRTSSGVPMLIVTSEAAYTDQHGELLLTNTETLVFTVLAGAR